MLERGILYPIARAEDGTAIHIDAWERSQEVTCFGCDKKLVGRLPHDGIKPTAHFAHVADTACGGETALHRAAKATIVQAHGRGALKDLVWECPLCRRSAHRTDLSALAFREEDRPCKGVASDVLGRDLAGDPRLAIEVVVTHDVELATLERYREQGLFVFTFRPSWGSVGDLALGADALRVDHRLGDVDSASCSGCQQLLREKLEWERRERERKESAWWSAWLAAWIHIEREARRTREELLLEAERLRAREVLWWVKWPRAWRQIGGQPGLAWWSAWDSLWRTIGAERARPFVWSRAWLLAWEEIGQQRVAEEAAKVRRIIEAAVHEKAVRQSFWPTWIGVWLDIGKRESGVMSAWRPICRNCRQNLTRDHSCP